MAWTTARPRSWNSGFCGRWSSRARPAPNPAWEPLYITVSEVADSSEGSPSGTKSERLLGAVAAYIKSHSYGEYIFDWSWASAAERNGIRYYPKLVIAAPATPATGKRILLRPDLSEDLRPAGHARTGPDRARDRRRGEVLVGALVVLHERRAGGLVTPRLRRAYDLSVSLAQPRLPQLRRFLGHPGFPQAQEPAQGTKARPGSDRLDRIRSGNRSRPRTRRCARSLLPHDDPRLRWTRLPAPRIFRIGDRAGTRAGQLRGGQTQGQLRGGSALLRDPRGACTAGTGAATRRFSFSTSRRPTTRAWIAASSGVSRCSRPEPRGNTSCCAVFGPRPPTAPTGSGIRVCSGRSAIISSRRMWPLRAIFGAWRSICPTRSSRSGQSSNGLGRGSIGARLLLSGPCWRLTSGAETA